MRLAGRISGIFNITLIDFDRFTAASIINNSLYAGALAGPGGHTRLFYTQAYYAKDVGTGVPPFPPICGRIHLFSFPGNLDLNQLNGIKCSSSPLLL